MPTLDEGWLDLDDAAVVEITIGREGISGRVCTGLRRNVGLACRRFWHSNHPANLRRAAKTHTHLARLRRNRDRAYPRVRLAMVSRWRTLVSRNCAAAVEFQSP